VFIVQAGVGFETFSACVRMQFVQLSGLGCPVDPAHFVYGAGSDARIASEHLLFVKESDIIINICKFRRSGSSAHRQFQAILMWITARNSYFDIQNMEPNHAWFLPYKQWHGFRDDRTIGFWFRHCHRAVDSDSRMLATWMLERLAPVVVESG
jgi:hypothetical protein